MKTVAIIWICALISGVTCVKVVNNTLNDKAVSPTTYQVQPAEALELGNNTCLQACNEPQIQPAKPLNQ